MPAIKLGSGLRYLPTILAFVTATVAAAWLGLSAKAEYERDLRLGERQTQLLATGLQDTAERQFNEVNSEIVTIQQVVERHLKSTAPSRPGLREEALRALNDDGDILRVIVRVDGHEVLNLSPVTPEPGEIDLAAVSWSSAEAPFGFGYVNIGVPVRLDSTNGVAGGGTTVPMRYRFITPAGGPAIEVFALTDATQVLRSYESVDLADGSAFAVFRADGYLLARWPVMEPYIGRKFEGPIFGDGLKKAPTGTVRAQVDTDSKERILTFRTARGWPLVVVAGVPVQDLLSSWIASLPGKLVLLLTILSAIFLLWAALRQSRAALLSSVEKLTASEGRLARLLANIPGGVFTRRFIPPGTVEYTFASEGFRKAFGTPAGNFRLDTESLVRLVHPDDRKRMYEAILASCEGDEVLTQEFRAIRPNGQLVWVQSVARRYTDEDGNIFWDGIAIDVTDLRQHQALLENVQRIAGLGYWIWQPERGSDTRDQSLRRTQYSPACAAILGLRPEELQITDAEFVERLVHPDDREAVRREYQYFLDTEGAPHDIQYRIQRPGGALRWVHCTATKDIVDGKVVRIIGVLQDITEAKLHEAELAQAKKMEAIGGLTGGVAHDFNNLLTVVIGNLEALLGRIKGDATATDLAQAALGAADRGATLTKRLLAFARRQPLSPRSTDLHQLLVDLLPLLKRSVGALIEVTINAAPDLPKALVDPNQLENAILNLANNARDAMPRGGRLTIGVDLGTWLADDETAATPAPAAEPGPCLRISVTDTGIGMTPEVLARAVEPFFTTKPVGQGTGLGLSMVYGLAKQSKGQLRLYSEPGIGTTIRLYLPVATGGAAGPAPDGGRADAFDGMRALLVDDDAAVRATTAAILRSLGFEVSQAATGKEAIAVLENPRPIDVLITDVILAGGMAGPDVAERAKKLRPELKVLFISGFASDSLAELRPLLSKPFRRAEMAAELAKLLRRDLAEV
ncbi:MAG: PAS domain-containing protein [Rhodospirillaceae bacterium]|nr:PAS domain-containing protein [Rhodospirillaceae bacterium]